jgi:2-polyprenyl-6-methoxyphenol hydroxylase-like FAD-dependent oxidoreductase
MLPFRSFLGPGRASRRSITTMSQHPISIIGAGIGGLTLGRCLLKRGVPAVLYERMPSTPRHGYGITLHASSYRPLLDVLGLDEWTFRRRVAVDGLLGGGGDIDPRAIAYPGEIESTSFRAHREKLERLLREGLDVQWEHALDKVVATPSGVTIRLQSGQELGTRCVIGVDGPHSNTRKSLSPNIPHNVAPYVAFNGTRRVKRALFDSLYAPAMKTSNIIEIKQNDVLLNISVSEQQEDLVSISWIYSRPAKGPKDILYKPNRPLSGATDIPDEFFQGIEALQDLDQPFKEVFDAEKLRRERILNWLMRTVLVSLQDLQELAPKGIFFMGDAVHAEPILGGQGANNAITDGLELAECIATSGLNGIPTWYDRRYPMWESGIRKSQHAIAEMHSTQKANL